MCWDSYQEEIEYDDYIFNHEEILKIYASQFLIRMLNRGDVLILKISDNQVTRHIECTVYKKINDCIYVLVKNPSINKNMQYIKRL